MSLPKLLNDINSKFEITGGALEGNMSFNSSDPIIYNSENVSGKRIRLYSGAGAAYDGGAGINLYQKDHTTTPGMFMLSAHDGINEGVLRGYPNGDLTWNGSKLYGEHNQPQIEEVISIAKGGTGATDAATALSNLGAASSYLGIVPDTNLLTWFSTQKVSGGFIVDPTKTTEGLPETSWYSGYIDKSGFAIIIGTTTKRIFITRSHTDVWQSEWIELSGNVPASSVFSNVDLNTLVKDGFYFVAGNTTDTNNFNLPEEYYNYLASLGTGKYWEFQLITFAIGSRCCQIGTVPYSGANVFQGRLYFRVGTGSGPAISSWTAWDRYYSANNKPTAADVGAISQQCVYYNTTKSADDLTDSLALIPLSSTLNSELFNIMGESFAYVMTFYYSSLNGSLSQVAYSYKSSIPRMAVRNRYNGTWSAWNGVAMNNNYTKIHSNAKATTTDLTHIPTDAEIVLETGDGRGGVSAWIWREKYQDNWGIFHDNASNVIKFVGNNTERASINLDNGTITGTTVKGAVWNDYAEYRAAESIEPGRVVIEDASGEMKLATERLQPGAEIISDTFGFAIGETEDCRTPIAATGRVLAYTYEDRNSYPLGAAVCSGPNGTVSLMTREEIREYPERIIGTVSEIPKYETWGQNNVKVNNRIWIRIK